MFDRLFFHPNAAQFCKQAIDSCLVCSMNLGSRVNRKNTGPMKSLIPIKSNEILSLDVMQNLPLTLSGYSHILVCVCHFSQMVFTVALKGLTAQETLHEFMKII